MPILKPREGSYLERQCNWTPPDPAWVSASEVKRVRAALKGFHYSVNLWWEPNSRARTYPDMPGRWRVMRWLEMAGDFQRCFYWEGPNGEYRGLEGAADAMLKILLAGFQDTIKERDAKIEAHNESLQAKRIASVQDDVRRYTEDWNARAYGIRETFGVSGPRKRTTKPEDLVNSNHAKYVRSLQKQA